MATQGDASDGDLTGRQRSRVVVGLGSTNRRRRLTDGQRTRRDRDVTVVGVGVAT